jgi:hypothetical protein
MLAILGLILGLIVLVYAVLAYMGNPMLASLPPFLQRKGDLLWLAGCALVGLALVLGIVGTLITTDLRILRLLLGIVGLLLLVLAWPKSAARA